MLCSLNRGHEACPCSRSRTVLSQIARDWREQELLSAKGQGAYGCEEDLRDVRRAPNPDLDMGGRRWWIGCWRGANARQTPTLRTSAVLTTV